MFAQSLAVLKKDLRLEWRGRGRALAVLLFGVVVLLLFSFAVGPDTDALRRHAAGYLWLALLLSSVLALQESFRLELEDEALEGLQLLPVDPRALYYGKVLASTAFLMALALLLLPLCLGLYDVPLRGSPWMLLGSLLAGVAGLAAPGTLYSAMTSRARGSDVMLPLLLFPLVIPVLLASVKGTSLALLGDPMDQGASWLTLVACFDLVYWSVCGILFGRVLDT